MATKGKKTEEGTAPSASPLEPSVTEARVISRDLQHVRTYSKHVHGENFLALAKEFAEPRGHVVVEH